MSAILQRFGVRVVRFTSCAPYSVSLRVTFVCVLHVCMFVLLSSQSLHTGWNIMVFSKSERQEYVYTCSFIIKLCLPVYVQTSDTRYCNEEPMERTAEINSSLVGQTLSIDVTIYSQKHCQRVQLHSLLLGVCYSRRHSQKIASCSALWSQCGEKLQLK